MAILQNPCNIDIATNSRLLKFLATFFRNIFVAKIAARKNVNVAKKKKPKFYLLAQTTYVLQTFRRFEAQILKNCDEFSDFLLLTCFSVHVSRLIKNLNHVSKA